MVQSSTGQIITNPASYASELRFSYARKRKKKSITPYPSSSAYWRIRRTKFSPAIRERIQGHNPLNHHVLLMVPRKGRRMVLALQRRGDILMIARQYRSLRLTQFSHSGSFEGTQVWSTSTARRRRTHSNQVARGGEWVRDTPCARTPGKIDRKWQKRRSSAWDQMNLGADETGADIWDHYAVTTIIQPDRIIRGCIWRYRNNFFTEASKGHPCGRAWSASRVNPRILGRRGTLVSFIGDILDTKTKTLTQSRQGTRSKKALHNISRVMKNSY